MAASVQGHVEISPGVEMPAVGLGVYEIPAGAETERAVAWALEAGYRHVDTAQGYGNEAGVGRGLRTSGIPREQVFVTTKFAPSRTDPEGELERSLERLAIEQVDLYLVHSPRGGPKWAWPGMERTLERGLTRSIGVSNFGVSQLRRLTGSCSVPPAVNQVQFSPFQYRRRLAEACRSHGIALEAYSPLTRGADLDDPTVTEIAGRIGRTPAQVLLRWSLQREAIVIPKSSHRDRIRENLAIFDFEIGAEDMARLDGLDRTGGADRAREQEWWTLRARARRVAKSLKTRARRLRR
ncbi:MAG TPA: aldo/keto reductase [Solirubrobacterales bacterium]|jgi:diketogulonate reductase-like aldo/keto reductase|nr:aldo/keto reductase [Solirubrobacterales bacterium]